MVWETAWEERDHAPPDPLSTLIVDDQAAALVAGAIGWAVWLASTVEEATTDVLEDEVWQVGGRRPQNLDRFVMMVLRIHVDGLDAVCRAKSNPGEPGETVDSTLWYCGTKVAIPSYHQLRPRGGPPITH